MYSALNRFRYIITYLPTIKEATSGL